MAYNRKNRYINPQATRNSGQNNYSVVERNPSSIQHPSENMEVTYYTHSHSKGSTPVHCYTQHRHSVKSDTQFARYNNQIVKFDTRTVRSDTTRLQTETNKNRMRVSLNIDSLTDRTTVGSVPSKGSPKYVYYESERTRVKASAEWNAYLK